MKVETIVTHMLTDDDGRQFTLPTKPSWSSNFAVMQTAGGWTVRYVMDDDAVDDYWEERDGFKFFDLKYSNDSEAAQRLGEGWALFRVDKYEHGSVSFKLAGSFNCPWDTSTNRYLLAVSKDAGNPEELAGAVLREYTDWCNGEVYSLVEARYDQDRNLLDYEACGGYIGLKDALAGIAEDALAGID